MASVQGNNKVRKKIDSRIRTQIENCVLKRHRSFFVIVGDEAKDQVVNLHYMLTKAKVQTRPNVLWCYKKELGFMADNRARTKRLKKKQNELNKKNAKKNVEEVDTEQLLNDPFHLFLAATNIRFCYFKETQNILGNTYGMLVLQDFEGITPNILARTIETVEGGGMVVLLLPGMNSLKQLYTMTMDVHSRFRTNSQHEITARFNERFLLSLVSCPDCLVLDDKLNILPISSHIKDIKPLVIAEEDREGNHILTEKVKELKSLCSSLQDTQPIGSLVSQARSLDQAKAILQFVEAISEKTLQTTVALTASRGRGKSAALGLAIASAVAYGYSNIFVTSPSPENLKTLFEFIFKGFDALKYKDQQDYEIVQSTNQAFNNAIVRVNIFRTHRQTIQYIQPQDYQKLGQAELLVIDEAAAIPLPIVKKLLGPYLVYISSTINGYEGTGRSLSLKLLEQLREKSQINATNAGKIAATSRKFFEIKLEEPIRYAEGDSVEKWLYDLLCLNATSASLITNKCPHPSDCNLYYVNRDTLFSYNQASEAFLQNMISLYVSSHYKNTPNDLQIMSDAPEHHLFVLLGPIDENTTTLPEIYCVIQVAMEGNINKEIVMANLAKGTNPSGDLIPYLISKQYQESEFGSLSGARIVRIATHPDFQRMGYGSRAIELLAKYYEGELLDLTDDNNSEDSDEEEDDEQSNVDESSNTEVNLQNETIKPKDKMHLPPLLQPLEERKAEDIQYLGVSYGMTQKLFNFWKKHEFMPVYVRLTQNDLTGEHTCVMLKLLNKSNETTKDWLQSFYNDFSKRLLSLLGYEFRELPPALTLSLLDFQMADAQSLQKRSLSVQELDSYLSSFDMKRLESYTKNLVDYHVILDLLPVIARFYFLKKIPFSLSYAQAAILVGIGLQFRRIEDVGKDLNLQSNQVLALFNKAMRKFMKYFKEVSKQRFIAQPSAHQIAAKPSFSKGDKKKSNDMGNITKKDLNNSEIKISKKNNTNNKEILDIFEKPLEDSSEENLLKRKRESINNESEESSSEESDGDVEEEQKTVQKAKKMAKLSDKKLDSQILNELVNNQEYKITGITAASISKSLSDHTGSLTDGPIQVETDAKSTKKEIKPYMLKDKKEQQLEKEKFKQKIYKKGGKKKRKVKS
jgi:N-acetyltransferase 10